MALVCVQVSTVGNARTVHKDLIQSHFRENEPSPAECRRFTQCIDHYLKKKKKNIRKKYTLLNVTLNYISLVKVLKASYMVFFHCK